MPSPNFVAGGNILPSRFVKQSGAYTVVQAGAATDDIVGISQDGTRHPPGTASDDGNAANTNDQIRVFGVGEICKLTAGAAVTTGNYLKSDASARGIPVTQAEVTNVGVGAIALEDAAGAGEVIRVQVVLFAARQA
jgi:hypothetical protein